MRGCQKKVVFLKNTGSDIFEEAYFVLKSDTDTANRSEADIIKEANRIIEENMDKGRRINIKRALPFLISFALGATFSAIIAVLI